jgi:predicted nucleic acid-binding protein
VIREAVRHEGPSADNDDVLHVAVPVRHGVGRILTFDARFDARVGLERLS